MTAPGPPGLGRGVIVNVGDPVPPPWAACARRHDRPGGARPDRCRARRALRRWWTRCTATGPRARPVVVTLGVDPAEFRAPRSLWSDRFRDDPSALAPDLDPTARPAPLPGVGQHLRRPRAAASRSGGGAARPGKAGAVALDPASAGTGDVALPDGTPAWVDGGPRGDDVGALAGGAAVVPAEAVEAGHVRPGAVARGPGGGPGARPAGGGGPRVGAGPGHRPGGVGQDPGAHRAPAPPRRRPGLRARRRSWPWPTTARPATRWRPAPRAWAGASSRSTPSATASSPRGWGVGPRCVEEREVRRLLEPLVPTGRPPAQHRPAGPLPRGADHRPPRPAGPARGRGRAGRRARPGRGVAPLPADARAPGRHRLRRAGAAGASSCCCATARSAAPSRPGTATCWSTSSRT